MVLSDDGGVAVGGRTNSEGGGSHDILLVKLDKHGHREWIRIIGSAEFEEGSRVIKLEHSQGYVLCGVSRPASIVQILLLKTD